MSGAVAETPVPGGRPAVVPPAGEFGSGEGIEPNAPCGIEPWAGLFAVGDGTGCTTGPGMAGGAGRELITVMGGACVDPPMSLPMMMPTDSALTIAMANPPSGSVKGRNRPVPSEVAAAAPEGGGI